MDISVTYKKDENIHIFLYGNVGLAFDGVKVSSIGFVDLLNNGRWTCVLMDVKESSEFLKQLSESGSPIKVEYE